MFDFGSLAKTLPPLPINSLNNNILETAYDLYLQAPQDGYPIINLNELSRKTGATRLECRNTIVDANKTGRFPKCSLSW